MKDKHEIGFKEFSATFPSATIHQWTLMVESWEASDPKATNPYMEPHSGTFSCGWDEH